MRYHDRVHRPPQRLLTHLHLHDLLRPGDRVGVAVSGGIDSVALLRLLLEIKGELGIVLSVVHFNHKLRGAESDEDEQFVADLARSHGLEFLCDSANVAEHAARKRISVEAAARELRYGFFRHLLSESPSVAEAPEYRLAANSAETAAPAKNPPATGTKLNKVVTGHTLDDQAETVLMRVIRGTGIAGLSAIHPRMAVQDDHGEFSGEIVRPLLEIRRRELEQYLTDIGQNWREDPTNANHVFTRNRVRKLVLPLLEREFNHRVAENLSELADIARAEQEYWENEVAGWMGTAVHWIEPEWAKQEPTLVQISRSGQPSESVDPNLRSKIESAPWVVANASISRPWFLSEPIAVQRRVVKAIGQQAGIPLEYRHVEDILHFSSAEGPSGRELSLPLGWKLLRHPDELLFVTPDLRKVRPSQDYEYELDVPGRILLFEVRIAIEVRCISADQVAEYNPDDLLNLDSLPGPLRVRNWRAGDRFWPAHTKSPKKIKELLPARHATQLERASWPVIVSQDEVVWLKGFAAHAQYRARPSCPALLIVEQRWAE